MFLPIIPKPKYNSRIQSNLCIQRKILPKIFLSLLFSFLYRDFSLKNTKKFNSKLKLLGFKRGLKKQVSISVFFFSIGDLIVDGLKKYIDIL
jgi:hypothetical protein